MLDGARALRPRRCSRSWRSPRRRSPRTAASTPERGRGRPRPGAVDRREAAAGGRAVEPRGDRPLRVHARDLRRARPHRRPARAASCSSPTPSACCSRRRPVYGCVVHRRAATTSARSSTSCGPTSSSRSTGPTSGPSSRRSCVELVRTAAACSRGPLVIPLAEVQARDPRRGAAARTRSRSRSRDALGLVLAEPTSSPPRPSRRSRTPRWTATRCGPPTPSGAATDAPVRLRGRRRARRRAARRRSPVGAGRGDPHHDGRADARRRRRDRDGRAHRTRDGDDGVAGRGARRRRATTCGRPAATSRPATSCSSAGTRARPRAPRRARERRRRGASRGAPRPRRRAVDRRRAASSRARSRPGRSATRTGRCCSALRRRRRLSKPSTSASRPTTRRSSTRTLEDALASCDAVLTSGGVSVGDYDYVKAALDRHRATLALVAGRDQAGEAARVRRSSRGAPVFGLPGNPVSSLVSFELFARPGAPAR